MRDKQNAINSSKNSKTIRYTYCSRCGTYTITNGRCVNIEHSIRKGGKK